MAADIEVPRRKVFPDVDRAMGIRSAARAIATVGAPIGPRVGNRRVLLRRTDYAALSIAARRVRG